MRRAGLRINRYELLLAAVISARATSFIFSKLALEAMDTFNLLAVRCLLAFAVLAVLFFRRLRHIGRRTLLAGAAIGTAFFLCMSAELTALHTASSSSVSLLSSDRELGKSPSSKPGRKTYGNSSPFALCTVIRLTASVFSS